MFSGGTSFPTSLLALPSMTLSLGVWSLHFRKMAFVKWYLLRYKYVLTMWMEITYSQSSDESSIISAISALYLPELEYLGMITEPTAGEHSLAREEEDQEQGL